MNIFVGHLAPAVTTEDLRAAFSSYGTVVNAQVMCDPATNKPLGYGHVVLLPDDAARRAIKDLNRVVLRGRPLVVREGFDRSRRERRVLRAHRDGEERRKNPERRTNGRELPFTHESAAPRMPPTPTGDFTTG